MASRADTESSTGSGPRGIRIQQMADEFSSSNSTSTRSRGLSFQLAADNSSMATLSSENRSNEELQEENFVVESSSALEDVCSAGDSQFEPSKIHSFFDGMFSLDLENKEAQTKFNDMYMLGEKGFSPANIYKYASACTEGQFPYVIGYLVCMVHYLLNTFNLEVFNNFFVKHIANLGLVFIISTYYVFSSVLQRCWSHINFNCFVCLLVHNDYCHMLQ